MSFMRSELHKNNNNYTDEMFSKWQNIVDLVAEISNVKAGLIMRIRDDEIEVFVSSKTRGNPYKVGDREVVENSGLYCERVIKTGQKLLVSNALKSKEWENNPDIKFNLIAYLGFPIKLPDGGVFGTICILDDKENYFSDRIIQLMKSMADLIEGQLRLEKMADESRLKNIEINESLEKLRQTKVELEDFFNISLDLLCIANVDGKFIRVNKAWEDILGYPVKDLEQKRFLDFVHPEDMEITLDAISKLKSQKKIYGFTNRYKARDGTYKYIEWRSHPKGDLIYAAARDMTERVLIEEDLKNMNEQFELAVRGSNDGIWDWNIKTNTVYLSPKWKEQLGFSNDELENDFDSFERLLHPEDKKSVLRKLEMYIDGESDNYDNEFRMVHKDGSYRWIRSRGKAIRDGSDRALRMAGSHTDITESKQDEQALRKSEEMYRLIAENISDVILVFNMNKNKIVYVSPSVKQLMGYTAKETMGKELKEIVAQESLESIMDDSKRGMKRFKKNPDKPNMHMNEVQVKCKTGKVVWVEISSRFRYNSSKDIEVVTSARNIDDKKKDRDKILYLSYHDQLTGLYNRRFYEEELVRIDLMENYPISLVIIDLNYFKLTNDTYGHAKGDDLLKKFANILRKELRSNDVIARIGGDEFVILLPKTSCKSIEGIIQRIDKRISLEGTKEIPLSASFGCETKCSRDESWDYIFKQAEDKMYEDKTRRKNIK